MHAEPQLSSFIFANILQLNSLEGGDRAARRLAARPSGRAGDLIAQAFAQAIEADPEHRRGVPRRHRRRDRPRSGRDALHRADPLLQGLPCHPDPSPGPLALERGPAATSRSTCRAGPRRCSSATSTRPCRSAAASSSTTPPASSSAQTAVIEDDVSILQDVTLGGTGKETGDRHPKIRRGVMIGAGAKILGNIEVGQLRPRRGRLGGAAAGAAQHHGGGRAGPRRRRGRLRRAGAEHGPDPAWIACCWTMPSGTMSGSDALRDGLAASSPRGLRSGRAMANGAHPAGPTRPGSRSEDRPMDKKDMQRVETYLRRTFGNAIDPHRARAAQDRQRRGLYRRGSRSA